MVTRVEAGHEKVSTSCDVQKATKTRDSLQ